MICVMVDGVRRLTLAGLLELAEAKIVRLDPAQADRAMRRGAQLIDIRSDLDRSHWGIVPGSIHIPRTVLEWRLDPEGEWRNPHVDATGSQVVLLCDHGCSSVLAAATLVDLGFEGTADVIGGFAGWRDAGLPVVAAPPQRAPGALPGMAPADW
jgi:rhodanese-related sulfurtransferase